MRFLRDFTSGLPPRERAVFWVAVALALAVGFGGPAIGRKLLQSPDPAPIDLRGSVPA